MNSQGKNHSNSDLDSLFEFKSEKEELKHEAYMLMFKFLSEIERITEYTVQKKDLAKALNSSRSFVSQLFSGEKLASLSMLAKLQKAYNLSFEVKAKLHNANTLHHFSFLNDEGFIYEGHKGQKELIESLVNSNPVVAQSEMAA